MFNLIVLSLYGLSIKLTYSEIKKKEKKTLSHLKKDGYIVEDYGRIDLFFKFLSFTPVLNIYSHIFMHDNFDEAYQEFKMTFFKKDLVSESPLLIEVNKHLEKLQNYEYEMMKNKDIFTKLRYIEKRKKCKLFPNNIDIVNMSIEEQQFFINQAREKRELEKIANAQLSSDVTIDEKEQFLKNMELFLSNTQEKKLQLKKVNTN